jgi:hypothetical protein
MATQQSFDIRESSTLLAALRFYQDHFKNHTQDDQQALLDIATNSGEITPLSSEELDDLCERINFGSI